MLLEIKMLYYKIIFNEIINNKSCRKPRCFDMSHGLYRLSVLSVLEPKKIKFQI